MRSRTLRGLLVLLVYLTWSGGIAAAIMSASPPADPVPIAVGSPTIVYDTGKNGCDAEDVPDAPARAFRDGSGMIHFFAASATNRAMIGRSFGTLRRRCDIAMASPRDYDPSHYQNATWLTGFYAEGKTVYALVHNEFHGWDRPALCPSRKVDNCWQNALTQAVSTDDGYHFAEKAPPHSLIAALPFKFDASEPHLVGYFNPTNIIRTGGFYYAMSTVITRNDSSHDGICIMRTSDLRDPSSWRGWNGHDFTVAFVDPYTRTITDPAAHECVPIGKGTLFFSLGSLLEVPSRKVFVLTMRFQRWDQTRSSPVPGAYLFVSRDLIHWSKPHLILSDAQAAGHDGGGDPPPQLYSSLLDPNARDDNFQTLGPSPLLYTMIVTPGRGYGGWQLLSRPVHLDLDALSRAAG